MEWPQGQSYFYFSSEVLSRTSSHICDRWYLPIFLFRDGLLTLINNDSFIHLLRFWSSLLTILKFSRVMLWLVMLEWPYIGEGALRCSLNLSPNVPEDSPMQAQETDATSGLTINVTEETAPRKMLMMLHLWDRRSGRYIGRGQLPRAQLHTRAYKDR